MRKGSFVLLLTVVFVATEGLFFARKGEDERGLSEGNKVSLEADGQAGGKNPVEGRDSDFESVMRKTSGIQGQENGRGKSLGVVDSGAQAIVPLEESEEDGGLQLEVQIVGTEMFRDLPILTQRDTRMSDPYEFIREKIVQGSETLPYIRVVSHYREREGENRVEVLSSRAMAADQVLVRPRPGISQQEVDATLSVIGAKVVKPIYGTGLFLVSLSGHELDTVPHALTFLEHDESRIEHVEINGVGEGAFIPNDTRFNEQWGLHNTGQIGPIAGSDIDMANAWNLTKGSKKVVVAVLDSGLDTSHPDLPYISWVNTSEVPGNGVDDDGNGFVDDRKGWNFVQDTNKPDDDNGHGTHVTGTIGAKGNNNKGVAGVAWKVKILPVKVLNANNFGSVSDLIAGIHYAVDLGVDIMNLSLQNYPYTQTFQTAMDYAEANGVLMVCAAGNGGNNNDQNPNYPSSFVNDNIIAVASTVQNDALYGGSNYGASRVDLAAPGYFILSTLPVSQGSYGYYTGTSMAAPHVAGTAVLIKALKPGWTASQVKAAILNSVEPIASFQGKVVTAGRLNAFNALNAEPGGSTIMEIGTLHYRQTVNPGDWHTIEFENNFAQAPVVIMGPLSFNGQDPSTLRVRNVTTSSFQCKIKEWEYLAPGGHGFEDFSFIAMEPGEHVLGGQKWEARKVSNVTHDWKTQNFNTSTFDGSQILLTQVMSDNEASAVVVRVKQVNASSFQLRVQEEEAEDGTHAGETVGYISVSHGTGNINGLNFKAANTPDSVRHSWYTLNYGGLYNNPNIFASIRSFDGADPVALRYQNLNNQNVQLKLEEEASANAEIKHGTEIVSWLIIGD